MDNKLEKHEYQISFLNSQFSPDITNDPGSSTRCVGSTFPTIKNVNVITNLLNFIRKYTTGKNNSPNEDPYFHCSNLGIGGIQTIQDKCEKKCEDLRINGGCANRNTNEMGYEASGCDGNVAWCWCNSSSMFKRE